MVQTENHSNTKVYTIIAVVLMVITFLEWAIFKAESIRSMTAVMVPALLILSLAKFVLVCGYYMHLRYDHKWLWQIFTVSTVFAFFVFLIMHYAL